MAEVGGEAPAAARAPRRGQGAGAHRARSPSAAAQRVTSPNPEGTYQALEKYGRDLTAEARAGKLDPVIGRDEEIRRVMQVLSRRTKNNPVLIGEPGVGKTAIADVRRTPPRTKPHRPRTPPTPPITWCSSTYAVPGDDGPPLVPITPSVASASFSSSDSNQSSRISRAVR